MKFYDALQLDPAVLKRKIAALFHRLAAVRLLRTQQAE